ncbi:MAG: ornithine carbamoyltransferase, partial [Planctomycetota bacterium]
GDPTRCKVAFVGDGNNVLHSLMEAAALTGMPLSVATPDAYGPDPRIVAGALEIAASVGGEIRFEEDPRTAVADANAVYTDTWISMDTPEAERAARLEAFAPYQVNAELMARAHPDAIFMHCMPDHRGEEVTAEIVDGPRSVVFDLAENRLHTEVAILSALIEGRLQGARGGA